MWWKERIHGQLSSQTKDHVVTGKVEGHELRPWQAGRERVKTWLLGFELVCASTAPRADEGGSVGALRDQQLLTELLCALVPARSAPTVTREPPFLQSMPLLQPISSEQAPVAISCPRGQGLRNFCSLIKMW